MASTGPPAKQCVNPNGKSGSENTFAFKCDKDTALIKRDIGKRKERNPSDYVTLHRPAQGDPESYSVWMKKSDLKITGYDRTATVSCGTNEIGDLLGRELRKVCRKSGSKDNDKSFTKEGAVRFVWRADNTIVTECGDLEDLPP
jgi:hypothetical protein